MKNLILIGVGLSQEAEAQISQNILEQALHFKNLNIGLTWQTTRDIVQASAEAKKQKPETTVIFLASSAAIASSLRRALPTAIIFGWSKESYLNGFKKINQVIDPDDRSELLLAVREKTLSA